MDDLLARSAAELFARHATPETSRAIRRGGDAAALWGAIEESGFLDALVPEAAGGAGLGPEEALPVLLAAGRFAVPAPVAETMIARATLAAAGMAAPRGAIALAEALGPDRAGTAPCRHADWLLVANEAAAEARLVPMAAATPDEGASSPLAAVFRWSGEAGRPVAARGLFAAGAWAEAATLAGAMERILEETVRHAKDRQQFGRPIAAFQAVQQQIAVLTEDVFASRMAAQLAAIPDGDGIAGLSTPRIAAAKQRVGEATVRVNTIAHAVHGAMGITEELDLHLLTGRLQIGRLRFGAEAHWARLLGRLFLAGDAGETLSFVRAALAPRAPEGAA